MEELVISFAHTQPIDWLLPDVPPTGKKVEMAVVVIVVFKDGRYLTNTSTGISLEYWFCRYGEGVKPSV